MKEKEPWRTGVRIRRPHTKATVMRYLRVNSDELPSLQRPKDLAAGGGSLPLAELLEVHTKVTEALDVTASARRSRRRLKRDGLREPG